MNVILYFVIFLLLVIGLFLLLNIPVLDCMNKLRRKKEEGLSKKQLKEMKIKAIKPGKLSYFEKRRKDTIDILSQGNFSLTYDNLKKIMFGLSVVGIIIGLLMNNPFLSLVLAFGFTYIPTTYLRFKQISKTKLRDSQLQSAISITTNAYIQYENIAEAVSQVLSRIPNPIDEVFKQFLLDIKLGTDTVSAIRIMKDKINNSFFQDWCDDLITCCSDRDVKFVLLTHIDKMSAYKSMQADFDSAMYDNLSEFLIIAVLMIIVVPLMKLMGDDYFGFYINTLIGKIELAVAIVVLFVAISKVITICKPLSQRVR